MKILYITKKPDPVVEAHLQERQRVYNVHPYKDDAELFRTVAELRPDVVIVNVDSMSPKQAAELFEDLYAQYGATTSVFVETDGTFGANLREMMIDEIIWTGERPERIAQLVAEYM